MVIRPRKMLVLLKYLLALPQNLHEVYTNRSFNAFIIFCDTFGWIYDKEVNYWV
jgi:hypothetical protein